MEESGYITPLTILTIIFLSIYLIFVFFRKYEKQKYINLWNYGIKTSANVIKISTYLPKAYPGIWNTNITYSFKDTSGNIYSGYESFRDKNFPGAKESIKKGDIVEILYIEKNPDVNALYEVIAKFISKYEIEKK